MVEKKIKEFIKKPKKGLLVLSAPIMIAMFVQTMYNIVDTAFVGRLGANAIAALTFSFPIFFILMSINSGIGAGMGSRISRLLGSKKKKEAENTAMHGLFISIILAVFVFGIGIFLLEPVFYLFGATQEVLDLGIGYMRVILFGAFFMFPAYVLNNIFVSQGDTKTPMKVQVYALLLNIILDPIFIYFLGFGVSGAAIATLIAFFIALIISIYFILKRSYLKIHLKSFRYSFKIFKEIVSVGFPATLTMLMLSFYIIFINRIMAYFGTEYVASFGIVSRLESVVIMPVVAISIASITIVGMFFGAKRYDLLKDVIRFGIKISVLFTSIIGAIFFIFPSFFLRIFTSDTTLLAIGSSYLMINIFTFPLHSNMIITNKAMQGMGYGIPGLVLNIIRIFIVAVPLAYIFVFVFNLSYLWVGIAMVLGSLVSSIAAYIWLEIKIKNLNSQNSQTN